MVCRITGEVLAEIGKMRRVRRSRGVLGGMSGAGRGDCSVARGK